MNNVLLVGNGFDLAHGLLTKYEDFLSIIKQWDRIYREYEIDISSELKIVANNHELYKYIKSVENVDVNRIERLNQIINSNSWIYYYKWCEAEIDGWIDFEREIYPVIDMFEFIFSCEYTMRSTVSGKVNVVIPRKELKVKHLIMVELWKKYFTVADVNIYLNEPYISQNYGVLKKRILDDLRHEFEEFIEAFEIYLHEFVYNNDDAKPLKQIKELNINSVISFNYTLTEKLYGIVEDDVHHLHGMIREDLTQGKNNMVMGVNESSEQDMDFIYFVKYFQRIRKSSGVKYKELVKKQTQDGNMIHSYYNLYIYGHSLDETDADILKYVIGDKDSGGKMQMIPKRVVVFYYDETDYEQKVINLINLYGRDVVEEYIEHNRFEFVPTSSEVSVDYKL